MPRHIPLRPTRRWGLFALALGLLIFASCAQQAPALQMSDTISIEELSARLADSTAAQPALLHVGFEPLYRTSHIPGSQYVGAGSKPQGIDGLRHALESVPADQSVVLYCGCCPWTDCPNVKPAFAAAKQSGHPDVRVLYITGNFERDWAAKGLPTERGEP